MREKSRILQMVQDGKISAEEGMGLLEALETSSWGEVGSVGKEGSLRVRISSDKGTKANINVPLALLKIASKFIQMGTALIPPEARRELEKKGIDLAEIDFTAMMEQVRQGLSDGKLIDIETDNDREEPTRVQVYVE
jgi:hypothetical protein